MGALGTFGLFFENDIVDNGVLSPVLALALLSALAADAIAGEMNIDPPRAAVILGAGDASVAFFCVGSTAGAGAGLLLLAVGSVRQ